MKTFIALFCVLLTASSAWAQNYSIAERQARAAANAAARRSQEGLIPPARSVPPRASLQPNPVLQATLQNIRNLRNDFAALAKLTNTASITTEKQRLTNDLGTAALGAKPSQQSLSKLADDLATVVVGNAKLRPQLVRLAQFVHAIFNSSQLSPLQQESVCRDVQTLLTRSGVAPDVATKVVNDFKAIADETK